MCINLLATPQSDAQPLWDRNSQFETLVEDALPRSSVITVAGAKPSSKEEIEVISGSEEIPGSVSESPRTSSTVGATAVKPTVRPGGGGLGTGNVGAGGAGNPDSGSTGGLTGNVGGGTSTGTGAGNTNTGGGGGGGWTGGNTGGNTGTGAGGGTGNTGGSSVSNWINWLPWAKCKVTCGTGTRKRYRFCVRRTKTIQVC